MKRTILVFCIAFFTVSLFAQQFESPQLTGGNFNNVTVKIGGDFGIQFQGLSHHADSTLIPLGKGINLPTANFSIDADLAPGVRVNLTTYLASRHHNDTWVKGGYLIIDKTPFIKWEGLDRAMDYLTFKIGVMEINYGDAHFRRSDNGRITTNPFVGNYIMDAFTTAPAFEAMFRKNGVIAMGAITTGSLKPTLVSYNAATKTYTAIDSKDELAIYGKIGFDKQINDDWRLRFTLSGYHGAKNHSGSLYFGDRTGSRFYLVMNRETFSPSDVDITANHTSGRWGPGSTNKDNSAMVNVFTKYKGLELFGTLESAKGTHAGGDNSFNFAQYAIDGLYRFGGTDQFYGGIRYDRVNGDADMSVNRVEVAAGWDLLPTTVLKLEYVNQNYNNFDAMYGSDAGFKGIMAEAGISF